MTDHEYDFECLDCGEMFTEGVGYNNCEHEFCNDDCLASYEGGKIDAAMDRYEDDMIEGRAGR